MAHICALPFTSCMTLASYWTSLLDLLEPVFLIEKVIIALLLRFGGYNEVMDTTEAYSHQAQVDGAEDSWYPEVRCYW